MSRQILNGWKEISSYINRSVRTVQRWEALLGLPVYRPALKDRSAVVGFSDELDRWISRAAPDAGEEGAVAISNEGDDAGLSRALENVNSMVADAAELSSRMRLLQEQLQESVVSYQHRIATGTLAPTASVPGRRMGPVLTFRSTPRNVSREQMMYAADTPALADPSERAPGHSPLEKTR